jgi:hypothetical protein
MKKEIRTPPRSKPTHCRPGSTRLALKGGKALGATSLIVRFNH